MTRKLFWTAVGKFLAGGLTVGLLLFLPAGSLQYREGWLLMGILLIPMFLAGLIMMVKNPDLLRKRLQAKESEKDQQLVIKLSGLMFLLGFGAAGLCRRFGVGRFPGWVTVLGTVLFLVSYCLYGEVLRENTYLSRTIQVQEHQKVIDTGLYGLVRHPMYAVTLVLFLSMPLVLGSWISLLFFLMYPFVIAVRIRNEEQVLLAGLPGYGDYRKKVRWRLIPGIW